MLILPLLLLYRELQCATCYNVSDMGVASLTSCLQLSYLDISYCNNVSPFLWYICTRCMLSTWDIVMWPNCLHVCIVNVYIYCVIVCLIVVHITVARGLSRIFIVGFPSV